jgi:hypothetical protein
MLPQPMMPMSIGAIVWSDSHAADESVAGTRGRSWIGAQRVKLDRKVVYIAHAVLVVSTARGGATVGRCAPLDSHSSCFKMSSSFNFYLGAATFSLVLAKRNDVLHSNQRKRPQSRCHIQPFRFRATYVAEEAAVDAISEL